MFIEFCGKDGAPDTGGMKFGGRLPLGTLMPYGEPEYGVWYGGTECSRQYISYATRGRQAGHQGQTVFARTQLLPGTFGGR